MKVIEKVEQVQVEEKKKKKEKIMRVKHPEIVFESSTQAKGLYTTAYLD